MMTAVDDSWRSVGATAFGTRLLVELALAFRGTGGLRGRGSGRRGMTAAAEAPQQKGAIARLLDFIEVAGNKVPHPVLMFLYLIIGVIVLSPVLALLGVSVTEEIVVPDTSPVTPDYYEDTTYPGGPTGDILANGFHIEEVTIPIRGLLTTEGIRFIFTSFVSNFAGFGVVAVTFVALMGAGVAEAGGLMAALIRKLVSASPRKLLAFILVFVGVMSSVASDAGYLILVPLGAAAFVSSGGTRWPAWPRASPAVGAVFGVNPILGPDRRDDHGDHQRGPRRDGRAPLTIVANWFFSIGSLARARRRRRARHGADRSSRGWGHSTGTRRRRERRRGAEVDPAAESKGLRYALVAFLGFVALIVLVFTLPPRRPAARPGDRRHHRHHAVHGQPAVHHRDGRSWCPASPTGGGRGRSRSANDVIAAVTKTFAGLGGLVFMLLMISQFIAYFNFSNLPSVLAIALAEWLESAGIGALPLLIGMIVVILLLDIIIPGIIPKWAIFAPIFIPLFVQLGVPPQTGLAAYRVADSPLNTITPLMVYLPFMVTIAQRYQKDAGIGTIIALMLPYAVIVAVVWILLFVLWFVLGIPLGPGYPVQL